MQHGVINTLVSTHRGYESLPSLRSWIWDDSGSDCGSIACACKQEKELQSVDHIVSHTFAFSIFPLTFALPFAIAFAQNL